MALHLDALTTEKKMAKLLKHILQVEFQKCDDAFAAQISGALFTHASAPLRDALTGDEIGKYIYTLVSRPDDGFNELMDMDIVLRQDAPVKLFLKNKLPQSAGCVEFFEASNDEEGVLTVETVNRLVSEEELLHTDRTLYLSAMPFEFSVYDTKEDYNRHFGFEKPVTVGDTGFAVDGISTRFVASSTLTTDDDRTPWSMIAGRILDFREVEISFGKKGCPAYLITLDTAVGDLPTLVGKEVFDTSGIGIGKIVVMNAFIKANLIHDKYPEKK